MCNCCKKATVNCDNACAFTDRCSGTVSNSECVDCAGDDFKPQDVINPGLSMNVAFSNKQIIKEKKFLY